MTSKTGRRISDRLQTGITGIMSRTGIMASDLILTTTETVAGHGSLHISNSKGIFQGLLLNRRITGKSPPDITLEQ